MSFVENSKWKTRNGSVAFITTVNEESVGSYYNIFGSVEGKSMSWDKNGYMYAGGNQIDAYDLVECLEVPVEQHDTFDSLEYFRQKMFG